MITKIGIESHRSYNNSFLNFNNKSKSQNNTNTLNQDINWAYYMPFTGGKKSKPENKLETIMFNAEPQFKKMTENISLSAAKYGYNTITPMIAFKYMLQQTNDYIEELNDGRRDYKTSSCPPFASTMISDYCPNVFEDKKLRDKALPVIEKYLSRLDEKIKSESPNNYKSDKKPEFTEYLQDAIWTERDKKTNSISAINFVDAVMENKDSDNEKFFLDFWFDMCEALMINKNPIDKRTPFSDYDAKAKDVLKQVKIGTNMFVTYDSETETPDSFIDTIHKNADKHTKILEFNKFVNCEYFTNMVDKLGKDKNNKYIVIANPTSILSNSPDSDDEDEDWTDNFDAEEDLSLTLRKHPANVSFILYDTKNNYYNRINDLYKNFQEAAIPTMSAEQMVKMFKENPDLYKKDIKANFTKAALEKIIIASAKLDGAFPKKTQDLMKRIAQYNNGKKEITEKDAEEYLKEVDYLFKKSNNDSSVEIIFNTGRKVKDIIGKDSTKKEALNLVKQIKSNKMGTKGVIIYSQDGYPGGGRKFTAKAIAGEAKIPYIEINTMDFGTKDVDLFGSGSISPEKSIKKLFSIVTSQAENNKNKSAVLYIENFEYFSVGEMVSEYYQKAMAQLLREMDRAQKDGFNILVLGSVSDPDAVGETAMKSFKFVDQIEVSSTAFNKESREQVIRDTIKSMKIKMSGTPQEKDEMISYIADLTKGFPFIYMKNVLKKTQSVAQERNHKVLTKADVTEAYLQITTGRPAMGKENEHDKRIVTSHECGHATNLEVMNNIAKTLKNEWHIPDKVHFVTLDPRGYYGGAVYDVTDKNNQLSFERMFANLVYGFGGYSCENYFYGMDGSYGITCDMEQARDDAKDMVRTMGMGAKTGKMTIFEDELLSDKTLQMLEEDERVILNNAKIASDLITEIYADFNREFTKKYAHRVGTGECIISGDEFRKYLNEWKAEQSAEKQREFKLCDETIVEVMEATKRGVVVRKNN